MIAAMADRAERAPAAGGADHFSRRLVRASLQVDWSASTSLAGVRAALGVMVPLVVAVAVGDPSAGVAMAGGGLPTGTASISGTAAPPLRTMLVTTAGMGLAAFAGSASGSNPWIHVPLLAAWAFAAGLLVAVGPAAGLVGTQSMIALVVFGRFGQPVAGAASLAGFVLLGGASHVVLATLVRVAPGMSSRRLPVARAFRSLARLAREGPGASLAAGDAIDEARRFLDSPAVWSWPGEEVLRGMVTEAERVRLLLLGLAAGRRVGAPATVATAAAPVLDGIADALEGGDAAAASSARAHLEALAAAVPRGTAAAREAALAGQLRAVTAMLTRLHGHGRPGLGHLPRAPRLDPAGGLRLLEANLALSSTALRHAVRLAVVVPAASVIALHTPLQRGYWVALTVVIVLKPDFTSTMSRGVARLGGTCAGVVLASLITATLHPSGAALVVVVGVLAWAGFSTFRASYALYSLFLTAVVVFLLGVVTPNPSSIAPDRLVDTLVGGALALAAYAVWPTWTKRDARDALGDLAARVRGYLAEVVELRAREAPASPSASEVRRLQATARSLRLARSNAEASVGRSLGEPPARRIDAAWARGTLAALRRIALATHALAGELLVPAGAPAAQLGRSGWRGSAGNDPVVPGAGAGGRPELAELGRLALDAIGQLELAIREPGRPASPAPALRAAHGRLAAALAHRPGAPEGPGAPDGPATALLADADELVDAINSAGFELGAWMAA